MSVPFPLGRARRRWPAQAKQARILLGDKETDPGHGTNGRLNTLGKYNTERTPPHATNHGAGESAGLQRQAEELSFDSAALLDRVSLRPGHSAIDLGCGPRGILDLLAARVSPGNAPVAAQWSRPGVSHRGIETCSACRFVT